MRFPFGVFFIFAVLLSFSGIFYSCAGAKVVTLDSLNKRIETFRGEIRKDRNAMLEIKNRKVAKSGFYYILNSEGKVVFHPRALLVGSDFSKFHFIRAMLKKREGCYTVGRGQFDQLMIFKPLNDDEIICLSIPANEVDAPGLNCERVKNKNTNTNTNK